MTAPDQLQDVKLTLAKREPSTHDFRPKRKPYRIGRFFEFHNLLLEPSTDNMQWDK